MSAKFTFIMFLSVFFSSCSNYNGQAKSPGEQFAGTEDKSRMIYINAVESESGAKAGHDFQVKISGNLPSPAYSFERFEVVVTGKTIFITPLASFDSNIMAAQMLVPFERVCKVPALKPGTYAVEVHGRGDTVVKGRQLTVEKP